MAGPRTSDTSWDAGRGGDGKARSMTGATATDGCGLTLAYGRRRTASRCRGHRGVSRVSHGPYRECRLALLDRDGPLAPWPNWVRDPRGIRKTFGAVVRPSPTCRDRRRNDRALNRRCVRTPRQTQDTPKAPSAAGTQPRSIRLSHYRKVVTACSRFVSARHAASRLSIPFPITDLLIQVGSGAFDLPRTLQCRRADPGELWRSSR